MKVSGYNNSKGKRSELEQLLRNKAAESLRKSRQAKREGNTTMVDFHDGMACGYASTSTLLALGLYETKPPVEPPVDFGTPAFIEPDVNPEDISRELVTEGRLTNRKPSIHDD